MTVEAICKRVAGLDVHKKIIVATVLLEQSDGQLMEETRDFGTLPADHKALAQWLALLQVELTVMESTGVYWKSVHAILEDSELKVYVVNARHVKQVPGRKTDLTDSQWLATLARFGLLRGSFIPKKSLRELQLLTRYRIKIQHMIAAEKNRLHKILDAAGIRLGAIVSEISGVSSKIIINGLIKGEDIEGLISQVKGTLKRKKEQLRQVLDHPLPETHRFLLQRILSHIEHMEEERNELDARICIAMQPYQEYWDLMQTIPGLDVWSSAALIAEFGVDMARFSAWIIFAPGVACVQGIMKVPGNVKVERHVKVILICEVCCVKLQMLQ